MSTLEARALSASLVVEATPDALATGVADYFGRSLEERRTVGAAVRERGRVFDGASRRAAFRRAFYDVVASL